jgi:hypothetical protein
MPVIVCLYVYMLDIFNNGITNYIRAMMDDIGYSARTAVASSMFGVPLATIAFMSIAAGTSLALLVSGPGELAEPYTNTEYTYNNMRGGGEPEPEALDSAPETKQNGGLFKFSNVDVDAVEQLAKNSGATMRAANRTARRMNRLALKTQTPQ